METVKLFEKKEKLSWEYDEEADVLYLSFGKPREAVGMDIGEGVIVRYDEKHGEIIGLTILGIRGKIAPVLKSAE
jgi:uncharacterized protein YuzE